MSSTADKGYDDPSVTAEPAQHIPCSTETVPFDEKVGEGFTPLTGSCTFCGETGITFPHTCKTGMRANRFDPYEALDDILQRLGELVADYISGGCRNTDEIGNQVNALRAYITGMER